MGGWGPSAVRSTEGHVETRSQPVSQQGAGRRGCGPRAGVPPTLQPRGDTGKLRPPRDVCQHCSRERGRGRRILGGGQLRRPEAWRLEPGAAPVPPAGSLRGENGVCLWVGVRFLFGVPVI